MKNRDPTKLRIARASIPVETDCMPLIDLTNTNFDEVTEQHSIAILDFWAPWCGPCRAFAPVFEAVAARHPDVLFGRINTEEETALARQFEIFSVPMLIGAKDGTMVYARPGALSEDKLEALIVEVRDFNG
jgi:thioredoxin 1